MKYYETPVIKVIEFKQDEAIMALTQNNTSGVDIAASTADKILNLNLTQ